eukprot:1143845-Pelagomonas_calceolata.AAC.6
MEQQRLISEVIRNGHRCNKHVSTMCGMVMGVEGELGLPVDTTPLPVHLTPTTSWVHTLLPTWTCIEVVCSKAWIVSKS